MIIGLVLTAATICGFIATGYITGNFWLSFIGAAIAQNITASIMWRIQWGEWNPYNG